jgi:hypothetical protein
MDLRQWQQMVANKQRRGPRVLFDRPRVSALIEQAARVQRRQTDLEAAWARVIDESWRRQTTVSHLDERTLIVVVPDPTLRFELTRQTRRLVRDLRQQIRGIQNLRFIPGAVANPRAGAEY